MGDISSDTFLPFQNGEKAVTLWAQGQRTKQYNFFAQDEWKLRRNLSISYGVRWELNGPPTEAGDRVYVPNKPIDGSQGAVTFVHADRWYQNWNKGALAPAPGRHVVARQIVEDGGARRLRHRVRPDLDVPGHFDCDGCSRPDLHLQLHAGQHRCGHHHAGLRSVPNIRLADGFPNELPLPTAKPSSFLTPPLQLQNNAPPARVFDPQLKLPTVHMWNLTMQRELPGGYIVSAGYVGRRGERLYRSWDANQIDSAPILPSFLAMQKNVAISGCRPDGTLANGNPCTGAAPVPLIQQGILTSAFVNSTTSITDLSQNAAGNMAGRIEQTTLALKLRPNQQFAQILYFDNGGDSVYHALQVTFRKRFDQPGPIAQWRVHFQQVDRRSVDRSGGLHCRRRA